MLSYQTTIKNAAFTHSNRGARVKYTSKGRRVSNTNDDCELWVLELPGGKFSIIPTSLTTILNIWPPDCPL